MSERLKFWRYTLLSKQPLNRRSARREFPGLLIAAHGGFGNIHPWPELGDAPLEEQLEALTNRRETPLTRQALACCQLDGAARQAGRSLFANLPPIPASHYLMGTATAEEAIVPEDISVIKLKCGPNAPKEAQRLQGFAEHWPDLRFRLDFNETLSREDWNTFCNETQKIHDRIDFVEDPLPYAAERWEPLQAEVPFDLAVDRASDTSTSGFRCRVIKPARQVFQHAPGERTIITSYLDHPIGQLFAAHTAATHADQIGSELCGLATHDQFENTEFSEAIQGSAGTLRVPEGSGLGFDELLSSIPWETL